MTTKKFNFLTIVFLFLTIFIISCQSIFAQTNPVAEQLRQAAANLQNGQLNEAETILRRLTRTAPTNVDAHNLLGIVLDQKGNLTEAEREYRLALKSNPRAVSPLANLGILLAKTKRETEAIQTFEKVLANKTRIIRKQPSISVYSIQQLNSFKKRSDF